MHITQKLLLCAVLQHYAILYIVGKNRYDPRSHVINPWKTKDGGSFFVDGAPGVLKNKSERECAVETTNKQTTSNQYRSIHHVI